MLETAARRKVDWPEIKEYGRSPVEVGQVSLAHTCVCHGRCNDSMPEQSIEHTSIPEVPYSLVVAYLEFG